MSLEQEFSISNNSVDWKTSDILSANSVLNQTEFQSLTTSPFVWTVAHTALLIILVTIVLGAVIWNGLVLFDFFTSLNHDIEYPTPTHFFIANLALADFLVGVLVLPSLATRQITSRWYFNQYFCAIWNCTHFWICSASILSTCAVCVERFIGVKYPIKHRRILSPQRIVLSLIILWIFAGIPSILRAVIWIDMREFNHSTNPNQCKTNQNIGHGILAAVGIFYIPASIMIVLYWKIYRIAAMHLHRMKTGLKGYRVNLKDCIKLSSIVEEHPASTSEFSEFKDNIGGQRKYCQTETVLKKQINLAKKLVVLVGIVLLSYGPYFALILVRSIKPHAVNQNVFDTFAWIRYSNSFINPFIYAYAVPTHRNSFNKRISSINWRT